MKNWLFIGLVVLLYISPPPLHSQSKQSESYSFQDISLGMPIAEFKIKHPAPKVEKYGPAGSPLPGQAPCFIGLSYGMAKTPPQNPAKGIVVCSYESEPYLGIPLGVSASFIDGKLAMIQVKTPGDDSSCLDPPSFGPGLAFYLSHCGRYPDLWQSFVGKLGPATIIVEARPEPRYHALRWETDTSVAEFENHTCGPWDGTDNGWGKAISQVLEGIYCRPGDVLSARQPMMLYLHKELSRTLLMHLSKATN